MVAAARWAGVDACSGVPPVSCTCRGRGGEGEGAHVRGAVGTPAPHAHAALVKNPPRPSCRAAASLDLRQRFLRRPRRPRGSRGGPEDPGSSAEPSSRVGARAGERGRVHLNLGRLHDSCDGGRWRGDKK